MALAFEDQLLIQCAQTQLSATAIGTISSLIQRPLDWDYVLEASIAHGIAPLCHNSLQQIHASNSPAPIPTSLLQEWQKLYVGNRARNNRLFRVIADLAREFARAEIPALGLKEIQLIREVYPDSGLRPMGDIDILIHPEDYEKTATLLGNLGFNPLPSRDLPFTLKYAWGQHFRRAHDEVWIDLQWNVIQREWDIYHEGNFDFEIERVWHGSRPLALDGAQIRVPQTEDQLFHLCLHLEGHFYSELILFSDIDALIRHAGDTLNWPYFIEITKKYRAQSSVYFILRLLSQMFATPLPSNLFRELRPTYFQGSLWSPLYDNLADLHLSLDQIRQIASPPDGTLREMETTVRQHTRGVMQTYYEIDSIASEFIQTGGQVILLEGNPSERIFPATALPPLGEFTLLILNTDQVRMHQTLMGRGYKINSEKYLRAWTVASIDPALEGQSLQMAAEITLANDAVPQLRVSTSDASKKDAALKILRAKLSGQTRAGTHIAVPFKILIFSPEEMMMYVCTRAGQQKHLRLFNLCNAREFLERYTGDISWQQLANDAKRAGVSQEVSEGLQLISAFLNAERIPPAAFDLFPSAKSRPRALGWARYDPETWGHYAHFKKSFLYLFTLLSIRGWGTKLKYLFNTKSKLFGLIHSLVSSLISSKKVKPRTTRDFAYWIE